MYQKVLICVLFFAICINGKIYRIEFQGRQFLFNKTRDTHENHDKNYEANRMETAMLRSQKELDFIVGYMNNTARISHVGMGMKCVNRRFIWNDGRDSSLWKLGSPFSCSDDERVSLGSDPTFFVESKYGKNSMLCTEVTTQERFLRIVSLMKNNSDTLSDTKNQMKSFHDKTTLELQKMANNIFNHDKLVAAQFDTIEISFQLVSIQFSQMYQRWFHRIVICLPHWNQSMKIFRIFLYQKMSYQLY